MKIKDLLSVPGLWFPAFSNFAQAETGV